MKRTLYTLSLMALAAPAIAAQMGGLQGLHPSQLATSTKVGAKKFAGFYLGANANVSHVSAKIENREFSGTGAGGGVYLGYGWAGDKVYVASELEVDYGSINTSKDTMYKLKSTFDASLSGRVGVVLKDRFMPYFRISLGGHGYSYTANTLKTKFNTLYVAPGLGVEALMDDSFLMRLETSYSIPISTASIQASRVQEKPKRLFFKFGGAYKF